MYFWTSEMHSSSCKGHKPTDTCWQCVRLYLKAEKVTYLKGYFLCPLAGLENKAGALKLSCSLSDAAASS